MSWYDFFVLEYVVFVFELRNRDWEEGLLLGECRGGLLWREFLFLGKDFCFSSGVL